MDHGSMPHGTPAEGAMDHSQMNQGDMGQAEASNSSMDHGQMDHSQMNHGQTGSQDMQGMDHSGMGHGAMAMQSEDPFYAPGSGLTPVAAEGGKTNVVLTLRFGQIEIVRGNGNHAGRHKIGNPATNSHGIMPLSQ